MGTLLDTSVLIEAERGRAAFEPDEEYAIAAITAAELLRGVHRASPRERARREVFVEGVIAAVPIVAYTLAVARVHARLWAELVAAGATAGAHDLIIAATAVATDSPLLTLDRRAFARIPGLRIVASRR